MPRNRSRWYRPSVVLSAALGIAGCYETGGAMGERAIDAVAAGLRSHAQVIPCSLAQSPALADSGEVSRTTYDGPVLAPDAVAIVVARNSWSSQQFMTLVAATAVDGIPVLDERTVGAPSETPIRAPLHNDECEGGDGCLRWALLPGDHVVTMVAVAIERDRRNSRVGGRVEFNAIAAHLYSVQVCRPTVKDGPVFWLRDETTLTCVSRMCPRS